MVSNTMACNMSCSYCYNDLPFKTLNTTPTRELEERLLELIRMRSGEALDVTFIGGEPLVNRASLYAIVDQMKSRAEAHDVRLTFTIYTNGLLLDERTVEWAASNLVSLVVSLDGPPMEHDRSRKTLGGKPTAQRILRNIRVMIESDTQRFHRVRCVIPDGADLVALHRYFLALGFNEMHLQPPYGALGDASPSLEQDLAALSWYVRALRAGLVIDVNPYAGLLLRLAKRGGAVQSHLPCDAGIASIAIGDDGLAYPCHHFFGEADSSYGPVIPSPELRAERFLDVGSRSHCQECFAKHMCGGECYHRAEVAGTGYFGVVAANCERRRNLVAPAIISFDELVRKAPGSMVKLIGGDYTRVSPLPEAYEWRSLSDVPACDRW